jgi:hypothetical protein
MPSSAARARARASFMLHTMTSDEEPASRLTTSITSSQSAHPALNTFTLRLLSWRASNFKHVQLPLKVSQSWH